MKKFIAIFFITVYAASAMGTTVFTHFCMNKVAGISLWHNNKCGKCGMTEKQGKGCCKDEPKLIKLPIDHTAALIAETNFSIYEAAVILPQDVHYSSPLFNSFAANYYAAHSPPDIRLKRNILNCIFRI